MPLKVTRKPVEPQPAGPIHTIVFTDHFGDVLRFDSDNGRLYAATADTVSLRLADVVELRDALTAWLAEQAWATAPTQA